MGDWIVGLSPVSQAFLFTMFTWGATALGASFVFFTRTVNQKVFDGMLAFAGGVMIAASFWSLLSPGIEMAEQQGVPGYIPAVVGFLLGGFFLLLVDRILPHINEDLYFKDIKIKKQNTVPPCLFSPLRCTTFLKVLLLVSHSVL